MGAWVLINDRWYYYNRANSYFWKVDYDNAMEDYRKAYELNPDETVYQKKVTDFGLIN